MINSSAVAAAVPIHDDAARKLLDLEAAVRALVYAHDHCPGEDLGERAQAAAWLAIRATLTELDNEDAHAFDAKAVSETLVRRYTPV